MFEREYEYQEPKMKSIHVSIEWQVDEKRDIDLNEIRIEKALDAIYAYNKEKLYNVEYIKVG